MVEDIFFQPLSLMITCGDFVDKLAWKVSRKGIFTMRSYKFFCPKIALSCPTRKISNSKVPREVSFFVWDAM